MPLSTLEAIRTKVRNVTGRSSSNQISDADIDFYINTFYIYDFPEHLRLQTLKDNYVFFTSPNVEQYDFPIEAFLSNQDPAYVAGYQAGLYQDQTIFYSKWPKINFIQSVGTGDGVDTTPTLTNLSNLPAIPGTVSLSTIIGGNSVSYLSNIEGNFLAEGSGITGITQAATAVVTSPGNTVVTGDTVFIENVLGMTQINGGPYIATLVVGDNITLNVNSSAFTPYESSGDIQRRDGTVNFITGAIALDWGVAPDNGENIESTYIPYVASRPRDILFFNNRLIMRPIPDRAYKIEIVAYMVPTELFAASDAPELRQWWQLLAFGASLKIFEDNGDFEQYREFRPLFEEQLALANRRTVKQQTTRRIATPYSGAGATSGGLFYDIYGS